MHGVPVEFRIFTHFALLVVRLPRRLGTESHLALPDTAVRLVPPFDSHMFCPGGVRPPNGNPNGAEVVRSAVIPLPFMMITQNARTPSLFGPHCWHLFSLMCSRATACQLYQ